MATRCRRPLSAQSVGWLVQRLRGKVVWGRGEFSQWIEKLSALYARKTGVEFYPGTLNLQLDDPWTVPPNPIRLEGHEYGGHVSVNIVPCEFHGRRGFILRTDQNEHEELHHPRTILEVAADVRLRDEFGLRDGDYFEVSTA